MLRAALFMRSDNKIKQGIEVSSDGLCCLDLILDPIRDDFILQIVAFFVGRSMKAIDCLVH